MTFSYEDTAGNSITEEIIYQIEKRTLIYSDGRRQIESKGKVINRPDLNPETGTITLYDGSYLCFEDKIAGERPQRRGGRTLTVTRLKPQRILESSTAENFSKMTSRYEYVIDGDREYLLTHTGQLFESHLLYWKSGKSSGPLPVSDPMPPRRHYTVIQTTVEDYDPDGNILNATHDLQERKNTFGPDGELFDDKLINTFRNHHVQEDGKTALTETNYRRTTQFGPLHVPKKLEVLYIVKGPHKSRAISSLMKGNSSGQLHSAWVKEYHDNSLVDTRLWLNRLPSRTKKPFRDKFYLTPTGISRLLRIIRSWEESYAANGQPVSPYAFPFDIPVSYGN